MNAVARRLVSLLASLALLTMVFTGEVAACQCVVGAPICQSYWSADAVFAGTVIGIEEIKEQEKSDGRSFSFSQLLVRLDVSEVFRGPQAAQLEVVTGRGGGDCGYSFSKGVAYIVYAHRASIDGRLHTNICTRTRELDYAAEDLNYIRSLAGAAPTAVLYGKVVRQHYDRAPGADALKPIVGVEVFIEGAGKRVATRTDAAGLYRVAGLSPGAYEVKLKPPPGLFAQRMYDEGMVKAKVELVAHGCTQEDFYFQSANTVTGRVVDAAGQPVADLHVSMRGAGADFNDRGNFHNARTDAAGHFAFNSVPPGDYLLGHRIVPVGWSDVPSLPRTYYPGVATKVEASVISVKEGEPVADLELRLLPRLTARRAEGVVVWEDGRPASGVTLEVSLHEEGTVSELAAFGTDERGRFTLKLYEELEYKVRARPPNTAGKDAGSEWIEVPRAAVAISLKLVLPILTKAPEKTAKPN